MINRYINNNFHDINMTDAGALSCPAALHSSQHSR